MESVRAFGLTNTGRGTRTADATGCGHFWLDPHARKEQNPKNGEDRPPQRKPVPIGRN